MRLPGALASAASTREKSMFKNIIRSVPAACLVFALAGPSLAVAQDVATGSMPQTNEAGIVTVKSAYSMSETIARLKKDIADKGIKFFSEVDQSRLAADAGIKIRPSILLVFGNPPLGTLFIAANPLAGLDWPVRVLVFENEKGEVWTAYTDFGYVARRHQVEGMDSEPFQKASGVIASITSSVAGK
jgi:uncharacterized protein (DUF302 family)